MTTRDVCTYNGKRYPRPEDGKMLYLSEVMARLGGTSFVPVEGCYLRIFGNNFGDYAPEGMECLWEFMAIREPTREGRTNYMVPKRQVAGRGVALGLMTKAEFDQPQVFPAD